MAAGKGHKLVPSIHVMSALGGASFDVDGFNVSGASGGAPSPKTRSAGSVSTCSTYAFVQRVLGKAWRGVSSLLSLDSTAWPTR
jgi:hypothetical protein